MCHGGQCAAGRRGRRCQLATGARSLPGNFATHRNHRAWRLGKIRLRARGGFHKLRSIHIGTVPDKYDLAPSHGFLCRGGERRQAPPVGEDPRPEGGRQENTKAPGYHLEGLSRTWSTLIPAIPAHMPIVFPLEDNRHQWAGTRALLLSVRESPDRLASESFPAVGQVQPIPSGSQLLFTEAVRLPLLDNFRPQLPG